MPYIDEGRRAYLNFIVDELESRVHYAGELNYILFAFARRLTPGYRAYRDYLGELNECVAEIRRRMVAPYEDKKIEENDDV